jgi:general secretion pathway protein L
VPGDSPTGSEIVEVEHWIIRRDRAREALAQIGLTQDDVDALRIGGSEPRAVMALRETTLNDAPWGSRAVRAAAVAAIAVTLLGAIAVEWLSAREMTRIADAIVDLRGQGNGANDPVAQLLAIKAGPKMLEVWDELSRLLPDHTYLNELRVVDGAATISGYSADAANLLRLLDQSALFTAARLTGPITPDKAERKDRFTLAFRLRDARRGPQRSGPAVARSDP